MDKTTAHQLAEEFANIANENATVTEYEEGSFKIELTSEIAILVDKNGGCEFL